MTASGPFTCVLDVRASLGECPLWADDERVLYWVDINAPSLNRFDPESGRNTVMPMPSSIGSFCFREGGGFVTTPNSMTVSFPCAFTRKTGSMPWMPMGVVPLSSDCIA